MSAAAVIPPHPRRSDEQWQYLRAENDHLAGQVVALSQHIAGYQPVLDAAVVLVDRLAAHGDRPVHCDDEVFDPLFNAVADLPDLDERSQRLGAL